MPNPATITRLVSQLTKDKVRELLVELLLETAPKTPQPQQPAARRGRNAGVDEALARCQAMEAT